MNPLPWLSLIVTAAALNASLTLQAALGPVQAVSLADPSLTGSATASGDSLGSLISPDGSFVVFMSDAGNLVSNDNNGLVIDIFLRERTNGVTTLVSVNASGTGGGNGNSLVSGFTPDGRFVVFESTAGDLVPNDTNGVSDVFVRDVVAGQTILVSANPAGEVGNGASSDATITPDGRHVAFLSAARDLVPGDTNGIPDVFVRDLQTGTTMLVSVGAQATPPAGIGLDGPAISTNGQFVAFASTASNLVAGVGRQTYEVYVRDLVAGLTRFASTNVAAAFSPSSTTPPQSYGPVLSDDGRWIVFKAVGGAANTRCLIVRSDWETGTLGIVATNADYASLGTSDNFGPVTTPDGRFLCYAWTGTAPAVRNLYFWDALSGLTLPVSLATNGVMSTTGASDTPMLSPDGRHVTFLSDATDLVTNAVNGEPQVYVRDLESGITKLVSADPIGEGSGDASIALPTISDDGRFVAFDSPSGAYVPGDRNDAYDVFTRDTVGDTTELVSGAGAGLGASTADGSSNVGANCVSSDGRWVVFTSLANDLTTGDTNGFQDVYVRDLQEGTNTLVSVGLDGAPANGPSSGPVISADGRYVAFTSAATNLAAGDNNQADDVFVRDLAAGTTVLVSVKSAGSGSSNRRSQAPTFDRDSRIVAFQSQASDLAAGDSDILDDVYVRNLDTGITTLASGQVPGASASAVFQAPLLSADGRFVAFTGSTLALTDLADGTVINFGSTNSGAGAFSGDSRWFVFAAKADGGHMQLVFHDLHQATNRSVVFDTVTVSLAMKVPVSVSQDARFVAFSCSQPVIPGDTNLNYDVFLYDGAVDNVTLVSVNRDGTGNANGPSDSPSLSADGRFLAYRSEAVDLVSDLFSGWSDIYLYDRLTGRNTLVSANRFGFGSGNQRSSGPVLAADGGRVVFRSAASDLAPGDFNETVDAFACPFTPEEVVVDPHPVFECEAVVAGNGGTEVSWNASPGRAYRVQFKEDLAAPAWSDLSGIVGIIGPHARISDTTAVGMSQRFYRVILLD